MGTDPSCCCRWPLALPRGDGQRTGTYLDGAPALEIVPHDTSVPVPAGIVVRRCSSVYVPNPVSRCVIGSFWNAGNTNPSIMVTQMRGVSGAIDTGVLRTFAGGGLEVGLNFGIAFSGHPSGQHEGVHVPLGIRIVFSVEGQQNTYSARGMLIASDTLNGAGLILTNASGSRVFIQQVQITENTPNDSAAFLYTTNLIDAIEADGEMVPTI
jgi:hypothetical protein